MEAEHIQQNGWAHLECFLVGILMSDSQNGQELLRSVNPDWFQCPVRRGIVSEMQARMEDRTSGLPETGQYLYTAGCGSRERGTEQFDSIQACIDMVMQRVATNGEAAKWIDDVVAAIGTPMDFRIMSNEQKREIMDRFKRRESKQ